MTFCVFFIKITLIHSCVGPYPATQLERTPLLHRPMSITDSVTAELGRRLERESEEHRFSSDDDEANTGYLICSYSSFPLKILFDLADSLLVMID
ncbi:hypothetical protein DICVIV_09345 [Dictyocaulus viviparus]|uniref:Uncharacterized protein n=1 Tax=Dictyocaulus viviparus TaxID=29172 RepID=A0A0D8XLE8_DICVI|nr:hypothetical protein DICVIV_09345 [Dictyocaulus viviparus]